MPDLRPYAGRWIALIAGRVAGSGRTPLEARQVARHNRPKERPDIRFVTPDDEPRLQADLPLADLMDTLRPLLASSPHPVYLVGGALRDALLGRTSHDLDFAVAGDAVSLARKVTDALGGAFYLLDAERGTARVILPDAVIDFARLRGDSLDEDLRDRDLTINTLALPAGSAAVANIIDLLDGQDDLAAGLVRAVGPNAILNDPIRGVRAVRQAAELGFRIAPETATLIRAAADQLPVVSPERIRDEFCRLLVAPRPADSLHTLDELELLPHIAPFLPPMKGVTQSLPHTTDVFTHTLLVVEHLDALLAPAPPAASDPTAPAWDSLSPFRPALESHLARPTSGDRTGRILLFLGALLHDAGKPQTRTVDPDGRIRFFGHEQSGEGAAHDWGRSFAFSTHEIRQLAVMVRHHMRPAWLAKTAFPPSRRAIYRFFRDTRVAGLDICLLCLADGLAKGGPPDSVEWEQRVATVAILLDHYVNHYDETVAPPPLLNGRQLIEALRLPAGPLVGQLLQAIAEAQAAGELSTPAGALALARELLKATVLPPDG